MLIHLILDVLCVGLIAIAILIGDLETFLRLHSIMVITQAGDGGKFQSKLNIIFVWIMSHIWLLFSLIFTSFYE